MGFFANVLSRETPNKNYHTVTEQEYLVKDRIKKSDDKGGRVLINCKLSNFHNNFLLIFYTVVTKYYSYIVSTISYLS